jgi:[ribosomal protein S5]-alanine N-acetyltransferase
MRTEPPTPLLESARLRLRPPVAGDVDALYALHSDPRVMRYWSFPAWTERAQAERKLASIQQQLAETDLYAWAIADRESDELIGMLSLFALRRDHGRAEIGYSLGPRWQGRGLATEALQAALRFAFSELALERIEADVDPRNERSCKLVERLGFVREGLLRARWRVNGEVCDTALYGLLRSELLPPSQ